MIRTLAIASLLFATQAKAGESIVIPAQPYSLKCLKQYGTIEACIKGLVEVSRQLTIQRDQLLDNNKQLADRAKSAEPAAVVETRPPVKVKRGFCYPKKQIWRTLSDGRKKYRCLMERFKRWLREWREFFSDFWESLD